ncbi:uncharacterized protein [Lolium perenne]|uniref:uncharacterized protein n=1 Tax=Lolium perenne TaxID=4522 RepID=UPI0021F5755A|nr:uncharacterized protein LOC127317255 [Lolium perenne]
MDAAGATAVDQAEGLPPPKTLVDWALQILDTADPDEKARLGDLAATQWLRGAIPLPYDPAQSSRALPDRPARSDAVRLLPPSRMPKLGKGGSAQSRLAMLHSLAHTESWAVDLSWDIVARFGAQLQMPREFFDDFARVAQDEGRHFVVLSARLRELGSHYGTLPAHDGLWDSAMSTSHCLLARLAVEHCVHEVSSSASVLCSLASCLYLLLIRVGIRTLIRIVMRKFALHCMYIELQALYTTKSS